ncbi:MAG: dTDP-4-dehydrorhamnose reductase [Pseudomonadota bacterium]
MRVLVTGCHGQLGQSLKLCQPAELKKHSLSYSSIDLTQTTKLVQFLEQFAPDVIVNAAAYTNVDGAESDKTTAFAVNSEAPKRLSEFAVSKNSRLIHVSTDYVYDGSNHRPYKTSDPTKPLGVYGESKLQGDLNVLETLPGRSSVIRTAWLYSAFGKNFVLTMLKLMGSKDSLSVVHDQVGSPTWASSLAHLIWNIVLSETDHGILHWSDRGEISWYDFAVEIQSLAYEYGLLPHKIPIHPVSSSEYKTVAKRPTYSVLDCSKTVKVTNTEQADWKTNLKLMLQQVLDHG